METKLATRLDNLAFIISATSLQSLMSELSSEKIQGRKCRRNKRGTHETLQRSEKSKKSDTSLSDPVLRQLQNLSPSLHRVIVSAAWISKQSLTKLFFVSGLDRSFDIIAVTAERSWMNYLCAISTRPTHKVHTQFYDAIENQSDFILSWSL